VRRYGVLALALFAVAAAGGQEEVPARPEALSFPPLVFTTPAAEPHRHALAAGNTVYVVEDPALPLFELVLSLPVGGFLDPPGRPGVAELTARLLERGPAAGRSSREIEQSFGRMAGRWSVATGLTRSVVTLDGLSSELEPSVALLFDLLAEPAFDPERIEQEKRRWIAERARSDAEPAGRLDRWWNLLLYGPDHVATRRPADEQILAITRDDLAAFHRRFWSPRHAGLAVSGDVPAAAAVDLLERQVRRWAGSAGSASTTLPPPPGDAGTPRPGLFLAEADLSRVWIAVGHPGPHRGGRWTDRGLDAWLAAQEILAGGGFTSRLVRRLRVEQGLVYWVETDSGSANSGRAAFRSASRPHPSTPPPPWKRCSKSCAGSPSGR
jgi:zinc protease